MTAQFAVEAAGTVAAIGHQNRKWPPGRVTGNLYFNHLSRHAQCIQFGLEHLSGLLRNGRVQSQR